LRPKNRHYPAKVAVPDGRYAPNPSPRYAASAAGGRNFASLILHLTAQILQVVARALARRVVCPILKAFRTDNLIFSPSHSYFL
jgi:hypothetical protein